LELDRRGLYNDMNAIDTFTLDELLQALEGAKADPDAPADAVRLKDLVAMTGRSRDWVLAQMNRLITAGQVECVKVPMMRIDGAWTRVPAYRVKR